VGDKTQPGEIHLHRRRAALEVIELLLTTDHPVGEEQNADEEYGQQGDAMPGDPVDRLPVADAAGKKVLLVGGAHPLLQSLGGQCDGCTPWSDPAVHPGNMMTEGQICKIKARCRNIGKFVVKAGFSARAVDVPCQDQPADGRNLARVEFKENLGISGITDML